ncbi:MAG: hypothetical protein WA857_15915 [Candidatus Acidiferrum sp.]
MLSTCANPVCQVPFDYRQGELFRFHKAHRPDELPPNTHSVQHFWLCAKCAREHTLVYSENRGVLLQSRFEAVASAESARFVAAA